MTARTRPAWVLALSRFIGEDLVGHESFPMDGADDDLHDRIEDAVNGILCGEYGHEIVDDQCGIPEHAFCVWCNRGVTAINESETGS